MLGVGTTFRFPADPAAATELMEAAVLCHKDPESGDLMMDGSKALDLNCLRSEFKEEKASNASKLNGIVEREVGIREHMDPQIDAEIVLEVEQPPSSGEDSDSSGADPSRDDMDLHQSFLVVGEGNGRRKEAEEIPEPAAQCGTKCKNGSPPLG